MSKINVEKIHSLTGHKDCLYSLSTGAEKNIIYTAGGDGMVVAWDLKKAGIGKMLAKVNNSIFSIHYNTRQNQLLVGQNFEGIHLIDLNTNKERISAKITSSYIFDIFQIEEHIFCACGDGRLVIVNEHDLSIVKKIQLSENSLRSIAYNSSLKHLAIGTSDSQIYILALDTLNCIHVLKSHTNSVFTVGYHPTMPYLISAGRDAHLKVWDTKTYQLLDDIVAHMYAINHIAFSPDSKYFATCSMDKSIKIWDAENFHLLKVIDKGRHAGHGTSINKLLWSTYNDQLISVSDDRSAAIWNIQIDNS